MQHFRGVIARIVALKAAQNAASKAGQKLKPRIEGLPPKVTGFTAEYSTLGGGYKLPPSLPNPVGSKDQWVKVHYWEPGYVLTPPKGKSLPDPRNPKNTISEPTFIPLSTPAAMALFTRQQVIKDPTVGNVSIGHVSIQTPDQYLSIGGDITRIMKMDSSKPLYCVDKAELSRDSPHKFRTVTYQSLNVAAVNEYISSYKKTIDEYGHFSDKKYNISGSEISSSDNCATSVYNGLLAGGAESLLEPDAKSKMKISPTAAWLFDFAEKAASTEQLLIKEQTPQQSKDTEGTDVQNGPKETKPGRKPM